MIRNKLKKINNHFYIGTPLEWNEKKYQNSTQKQNSLITRLSQSIKVTQKEKKNAHFSHFNLKIYVAGNLNICLAFVPVLSEVGFHCMIL